MLLIMKAPKNVERTLSTLLACVQLPNLAKPLEIPRDPQKVIGAIQRAIALDSGRHPTYLTVLALAYFRSGQLEKAVSTQKDALASPAFPPEETDSRD